MWDFIEIVVTILFMILSLVITFIVAPYLLMVVLSWLGISVGFWKAFIITMVLKLIF